MERDKQDIARKRYLAKQCENHARGESAKNQRSKNWNQDKSRNWVKKVTKRIIHHIEIKLRMILNV